LTLGQDGTGLRVRIRACLADPAPHYARFAGLLCGDTGGDVLSYWIREALRRLEQRHGIEIVELKDVFERNPNVCASPRFAPRATGLWTDIPGQVGLIGATLAIENGMTVLRIPGRDKPLLIIVPSAANIAADDPIVRALLIASFRARVLLPYPMSAISYDCELADPHWAPVVRLPTGAIVRWRRTCLSGVELERLIGKQSPSQRYIQWQKLAERYGWPALLTIRRDLAEPLLIPRDSPLALEAALVGSRNRTRLIVIEECETKPWLTGVDGKCFSAEIALPFERHRHFLSGRASAGL
jgi:hypothetical protein